MTNLLMHLRAAVSTALFNFTRLSRHPQGKPHRSWIRARRAVRRTWRRMGGPRLLHVVVAAAGAALLGALAERALAALMGA